MSGCAISRPAEEDRRLDLVAFLDEPLNVVLLERVIVLVDLGPELDFLDLDDVLMPLRFPGALLLLVLVLPVIHDPADRRDRRGRNLHEVEPFLPGDRQGLRRRHDAELLARVVDHADFTDADAFVDAEPVVAAAGPITIESDRSLLRDVRYGGSPQRFP